MSSNNYKVSLDEKKFTDFEISKYELEYGVKIRKKDNRICFKGSDQNVEKVKAIIKREVFLNNNPLPKSNPKPGSIIDDLEDLDCKPDYSRAHSKNSKNNIYQVKEFRFY
tara:strand:- start:59889 stop:60218 length:330 start_codon:yes stop_codon:yes gene_type:complete